MLAAWPGAHLTFFPYGGSPAAELMAETKVANRGWGVRVCLPAPNSWSRWEGDTGVPIDSHLIVIVGKKRF